MQKSTNITKVQKIEKQKTKKKNQKKNNNYKERELRKRGRESLDVSPQALT